jgi:hypothetical protein
VAALSTRWRIARPKAAASLALSFDDAIAHASSILCHLLKRHALTARRLAKVRALLEDDERSSVVFWHEVPHRHRCRPRPNLHTSKCALSGLGETSKSTPYRLFALASLSPPSGENNTALRA